MDSVSDISDLLSLFDRLFPENWINAYEWKTHSQSKHNFSEGLSYIQDFQEKMFLSLSKIVLTASFLSKSYENVLLELEQKSYEDIVPGSPGRKKQAATKLQQNFSDLLLDIRDAVILVRNHIHNVNLRFDSTYKDDIISAIAYAKNRKNRHLYVICLQEICDVCAAEYQLSYKESFVEYLIMQRQRLLNLKERNNSTVLEAAIVKLELMLYKLMYYSKNRKLCYSFNLNHIHLQPLEKEGGKIKEYQEYFQDFIDPTRIDYKKKSILYAGLDDLNVEMWKMVILMRYYCKSSYKSDERINNLLKNAQTHYNQSIAKDTNVVDKYADLTFINYMYNCRFSYMCAKKSGYSFDNMKSDLYQIKLIQQETGIYNYHPYQKAFEYVSAYIKKEMEALVDSTTINSHLDYLEDCLQKFKKNVDWCERYQPYVLQLRYKFSMVKDEKRGLDYFCPSSFIRPLRFEYLRELLTDFNMQLSFLRNRVELIQDKRQLMQIEQKIREVEVRSFERMAFFSTVIIFLVGLISIFTGNNHSVTLVDKIQYVSVLGVILLLFICVSYFYTSKTFGKLKPFFFGFLIFVFVLYLFYCTSIK